MKQERLENIVGALALAIADDVVEGADGFIPRREPPAAIALIGRSPGWTIRQLSDDIGLSHAATVRLVDRLVADNLVHRARSEKDGRAIELTLTTGGEAIYRDVLMMRHQRLASLLSCLSIKERTMLNALAEKILSFAVVKVKNRSRLCRFCDVDACKNCPIDVSLSSHPDQSRLS